MLVEERKRVGGYLDSSQNVVSFSGFLKLYVQCVLGKLKYTFLI